MITEFQGRVVGDPRTLSQSERDYLVRLAKDWSAWLGIPEAKPAAQVTASPAAPANPTVPASSATPVAAAAEPLPAVVEAAAVPAPAVPPLPEPPSPRSIVQQVDDILQENWPPIPPRSPPFTWWRTRAAG